MIEVVKPAVESTAGWLLSRLAAEVERASWSRRGLKEGWLTVSKEALAAGGLQSSKPVSPNRSLLFLHGTFSNTVAAFQALSSSKFFDRVSEIYADRIFAFDHFTIGRTPELNAQMLLKALPEQTTTFDVITHSRGGLVLRTLVERAAELGDLGHRFQLGRAILVASPNDGTPLATPKRWGETVGWLANLLELFPDNPFTTGAEFVANGLVWLAQHAVGDLPGLHAMDADGELVSGLQSPPSPPAGAYSALVANYQPTGALLRRLADVGIDQFFSSANDLVVPSEGGWHIDRSNEFIGGTQIGCFGPGGNMPGGESVHHLNYFSQPASVDFLINALLGRRQPLNDIDPNRKLPARRLFGAPTVDVQPSGSIGDAPDVRGAIAPQASEPLKDRGNQR